MDFHLPLALFFSHKPHELHDLVVWVINWVGAYPGLFMLLMLGIAGIPLPDELLLTTVGVFCYEHSFKMDFLPTLMVAWAGASCGITVSYVIGRTAGLGVVHKWGKLLHITPDKLEKAHNWYAHKKGRWALMFCVFAPVWRHLTAIVAGTSKMPFWEFMICAYSGTLLWVSTFITLGFLGGSTFKRTSVHVHYALFGCSILLGLGILAYFLWKNRRDAMRSAAAGALAGHCGDADPSAQSPAVPELPGSRSATPSAKTDRDSNRLSK